MKEKEKEKGKRRGKEREVVLSHSKPRGINNALALCSHSLLVPYSDSNYTPSPLGIAKISWILPIEEAIA